MKYLCLVYLAPEVWSAAPDPTCAAYGQQLKDSGHFITGSPLHPVSTATTVRMRNGRVTVTDGPFAETKEQLLGFYVVDCPDLQGALQIARDLAAVNPGGAYEIRPVGYFTPDSRPLEAQAAHV